MTCQATNLIIPSSMLPHQKFSCLTCSNNGLWTTHPSSIFGRLCSPWGKVVQQRLGKLTDGPFSTAQTRHKAEIITKQTPATGYPAIPPHLFLCHKFWGDLTCFCFNDLWHILNGKSPFVDKISTEKKKLVTLIFTSSQGIKMLNSDIISWLVGCFGFEAERSVRCWAPVAVLISVLSPSGCRTAKKHPSCARMAKIKGKTAKRYLPEN